MGFTVTGMQEESEFSRLAQEEAVMKTVRGGQCTVFSLPTHYVLQKRTQMWRQGTTPWNYCKALLETFSSLNIVILSFYLKSRHQSM